MRLFLIIAMVASFAIGCSPAAPAVPVVQPTPVPATATVAPTATPTPVPPPAQPPAGPGQEQVSGRVASLSSDKLALEGGKSYTLAANTRYSHPIMKSFAELKKGDFVAITAQLDPSDGALKASQVAIFAPTSTVQPGQRPLAGDGLMTNASIESIDVAGFTVTLGAGSVKVKMGPGSRVFSTEPGKADQVKEGMLITTVTANGAALSIAY